MSEYSGSPEQAVAYPNRNNERAEHVLKLIAKGTMLPTARVGLVNHFDTTLQAELGKRATSEESKPGYEPRHVRSVTFGHLTATFETTDGGVMETSGLTAHKVRGVVEVMLNYDLDRSQWHERLIDKIAEVLR